MNRPGDFTEPEGDPYPTTPIRIPYPQISYPTPPSQTPPDPPGPYDVAEHVTAPLPAPYRPAPPQRRTTGSAGPDRPFPQRRPANPRFPDPYGTTPTARRLMPRDRTGGAWGQGSNIGRPHSQSSGTAGGDRRRFPARATDMPPPHRPDRHNRTFDAGLPGAPAYHHHPDERPTRTAGQSCYDAHDDTTAVVPDEPMRYSGTPVSVEAEQPQPSPEGVAALQRLRRGRQNTARPVHRGRGRTEQNRRRWAPTLLGMLGAATVFAAAYLQFGDSRDGQTTEVAGVHNPVSTVAALLCAAERVGSSIRGNGAGSDDSGAAVIFAFQHAYYVTRSGEQARAVVAQNATVPSAQDIQQGIDTIPLGTTHCLTITPGAFVGQYTVIVTEYRPGSAPITYNPQLVTTADTGGRTVITGIGPMP
ncbi:hypothetical protein [Nocardia donostiensis]|nr:hypothetical protein [Nocardia donostiensis]